ENGQTRREYFCILIVKPWHGTRRRVEVFRRSNRIAPGLEPRRSGGLRPTCASGVLRIATPGAPLYDPGTARPHAPANRAGSRSLSAPGRVQRLAMEEPGPLLRHRGPRDA